MNNEQSNSLTPDITPMLDEAFNEGVDQSIAIVEASFTFGPPTNPNSIIKILQQLKKQPS